MFRRLIRRLLHSWARRLVERDRRGRPEPSIVIDRDLP